MDEDVEPAELNAGAGSDELQAVRGAFLPNFDVTVGDGPVQSFCRAAWGGLRDGTAKVDSTNRPNGLVRVPVLDLEVFRRALSLLLERHTILTCRVEDREGAPWLAPATTLPEIIVLEHAGDAGEENRAEAERGIGAVVWRPLDVATGPLYRAYAVRFGKNEGYIGLVAHHFVADGVSIGILMSELLYLYGALVRGAQPTVPAPKLSYQAYLAAMNTWMASESGAKLRGEVIGELRAFPKLDLSGRLDPSGPDEEAFDLGSGLTTELHITAKKLGVSPFTVLLAVQNVLLLPHCLSNIVPVKVLTTGREASQLMHIVGNMADRMFVLTDLASASNFAEVVRRTQSALSRCRKRAFVRYEFIQSDPRAADITMAAPVFNFRTVRRHGSQTSAASPNGAAHQLRVPPSPGKKTSPRDAYYLVMMDNGENISGNIRYGTGQITGFLDQFTSLISKACANPSAALRT